MSNFTYTKRKDGRLVKKVTVDGKVTYLYSRDKDDLEKQYIEIKYKTNNGISIEDNSLNVKEWANQWLTLYKKGKEESTITMYKQVINSYIIPKLGFIKLKNLKQKNIVELLNDMEEKGITRRRDVVLLTMKQMLNKAVENDYIYKNVALGIKIEKHKSAEKVPLSNNLITEIQKLAENDFRAFMILFMIYTGLRKEEIVPLQYKDIDLDAKYITIDKAVNFIHNTPKIKTTKNGSSRKVPILNILYDKLLELKSQHDDKDYVFPNNLGKMMSDTTIKRQIKYVINTLNRNKEKQEKEKNPEFVLTDENKIYFTYHQLRHTYVCILHKAGVDLKEAQAFTGHKTVQVLLDIYTHLDEEDKTNAINKLNNFIN